MMDRPDSLDWINEEPESIKEKDAYGEYTGDVWEYRFYQEYIPGNSSVSEIEDFIDDAKQAEQQLAKDLIEQGIDPDVAKWRTMQWPLKDNAPMSAIRSYIKSNYDLQEAAKQGIDL